jgi:hypothetical protein
MADISPFDEQRLGYINCTTNLLHDNINELYESLTDKESTETIRKQVNGMVRTLKSIVADIEEEI